MSTNNENKSTPPHTSAAMPSSTPPPSTSGASARERARILAAIEARLPELFALRLHERQVQTVGFFVAQYWNDEADDAVHGDVRYGFDVDVDGASLRDTWYSDDDHNADGGADDDARQAFNAAFRDASPHFNSNDEMITAFAAYATESSQDEPAYTPYCLWHRNDDGSFRRSVVGVMHRPEWEDQTPSWSRGAAATVAVDVRKRLVIGAVLLTLAFGALTAVCTPR